MRILISNDDGYQSRGLQKLVEAVSRFAEAWVVAPDRERSATGHAISLKDPLRIQQMQERVFAVDGMPTDCVNIALNGWLDFRPDFVFSGVNHGANLADDITYSGTLGAAFEGALLGVPAAAFSIDSFRPDDVEGMDAILAEVVEFVLQNPPAARQLYNINFPQDSRSVAGLRITSQGQRVYGSSIVRNLDPRGKTYVWIGGDALLKNPHPGCDLEAVDEGYVSLTPVQLDFTDHARIHALSQEVQRWKNGQLHP